MYLCPVNFYTRLGIFSALVGGGLFAWNQNARPVYTHPLSWVMLGFFILVTAGVFMIITRPGRTTQQFVRTFMAVTTMKLFLFLIILTLYGFVDRERAFVFIFHFLVFYFLFTIFEVVALMRQMKAGK